MLQKRVVGTSMGRVCAETVVVAHLHTHTNSKDHASRSMFMLARCGRHPGINCSSGCDMWTVVLKMRIATRPVVCRPKLVEDMEFGM